MLKIAHRGYNAPDNTKVAFENAIQAQFDVLECDLHCTKDNILILCHDRFILQHNVEYTYYNKLRELDPDLLTLHELFSLFPPDKHKLYLDLKGGNQVALVLARYLINNNIPLQLLHIASFNFEHLEIMRISKLKVKVGLITANVFLPTDYSNLFANIDFIVIDWNSLSYDNMEDLLLFEIPIFVYTCSNINEYEHIKLFPINGIVSDITFL